MKQENSHAETIGVFKIEKQLIDAIDDLSNAGFDRHQISMQGAAKLLKQKLGHSFIDPKILEENPDTPRQIPEMPEDFYWKLSFSIAIPIVLGMILGILFVGGVLVESSLLVLGMIGGALIGGIASLFISLGFYAKHKKAIKIQSNCGGFVLWVQTTSNERMQKASEILKKNGAYDIHSW